MDLWTDGSQAHGLSHNESENNLCICEVIWIRSKMIWVLPRPVLHASTRIHGNQTSSVSVNLLTGKQTKLKT